MNITKEMRETLIQAGWTPPPVKKPVNLDVFMGVRINCCFTNFDNEKRYDVILDHLAHIDFLVHVNENSKSPYHTLSDSYFNRCKPEMDYWFCHRNFTDSYMLVAELKNAGFEVVWDGDDNFKITGLREGYCWPWEV